MRIPRNAMPDSSNFNSDIQTKQTSAKFMKLLETIRACDKEDQETHGQLFKHFIFTDLRDSAYGAKAVASFLMTHGFDFRMALEKKQIMRKGKLVDTKAGETVFVEKNEPNGFAILQSLPLWKNPLSIKTKKDILRVFNSRPDNIHGEKLRVIVLDSKFKEGIDLFDVKYVHLLEPPISNSDLKQAVGRATRFCGQRGLKFIPNRGWPLEVYIYSITLPNSGPFQFGTGPTVDAHDLLMVKSGIDLALLNLTRELTVLGIRSAVDYDLNYNINNFNLEAAIIAEVEVHEEEEQEQHGGKIKRKIVKLKHIHETNDITPELLEKCLKRKTKLFPFTRLRMEKEARALGFKIPKQAKRQWYCEQLKANPLYLERLLTKEKELRSLSPIAASQKSEITSSNNYNTESQNNLVSIKQKNNNLQLSERNNTVNSENGESVQDSYTTVRQRSPRPNTETDEALLRVRMLFPSPKNVAPSIKDFFANKEAQAELYQLLKSLKKKPFQEFQNGIASFYAKFKWDSPVVKNGCAQLAGAKAASFSKTQDFIRHYLVPDSPFKGLLAWHSVGTGKTCMAIAAATTQFEQAGYTILWVTRNALMADVYKNIFGIVCSIPIMEELENGVELPDDLTKQKRMLSKGWLPPISYRTFQNALQGKNELGRLLATKKNGDPLHKTFLVMDEVHKLQDGDLSAAESADFNIIQKYIHDSYRKSKDDSVRPLLMTATPITDSPKELFQIVNTIIGEEENRLPPFEEFRRQFTNEDGLISQEGQAFFMEKAKGVISYLNREYDPTTFAQPNFHKILVQLEGAAAPTAEEIVESCGISKSVEEQNNNSLDRKTKSQRKKNKTARQKQKKEQLKSCYQNTRKNYEEQASGQIQSIEQCFGENKQFPSLKSVLQKLK